ncbi:MAG: DUF58 domain-containing protein [Deltaproteobacteria bacterium]|nr:DUF58 domain-containing protein [Deltaproteobacteria bacterium]
MADEKKRGGEKVDEVLSKVRRIEISTRRIVDTMLSGQYHTRFKGQGMQFSDFREYYAGDDIRHIDWKVTARTQLAHIKKFEEERDLTVYLVVDVSGSREFGSVNKTKGEALAEVCALLAFAAVANNDRVGLILFSDQIERHIPPKKGRGHAMRLVTEILYHKSKGTGTNVKQALEYYAEVVKNTAVVFLASDFYDKDYEKALKRVGRKHDLIALRMRDVREKEVPPIGKIEMQDAETGSIFWVDTSSYAFQKQFKAEEARFEQQLATSFSQAEVDRLDLWTHEDYFAKVVGYFSKRKRR